MQILAHRGHWVEAKERNTREALVRAFKAGFGAETDIRDLDGELVVSHDMPRRGALSLARVLEDYVCAGQPGILALNMKSDGLAEAMKAQITTYGITRYFCFDMSVPDTLSYLKVGLRTAARLSEFEPEGPLSDLADVLWVDGFRDLFISEPQLRGWLDRGKQICLVSPELHQRDARPLWAQLRRMSDELRNHPDLMLCTDDIVQVHRRMK